MAASTLFTPCRIVTSLVILLTGMIFIFQGQMIDSLKAMHHGKHKEISLIQDGQYGAKTFPGVTPLENLGPEGDKAWDSLTPRRGGFLWLQYNETYELPWGISMFHGIHCLQMLRGEFQSQLGIRDDGVHHHHKRRVATKSDQPSDGPDIVHLGHCLAYISEVCSSEASNWPC